MAWTIKNTGSWQLATTDNPASELATAKALPGTWLCDQYPHAGKQQVFVRSDQVATLSTPSPPIANPLVWFDASQITGQADNTALSSWPTVAGSHTYDAVQATGANQPIYYNSTAGKLTNGKPTVWFTSPQYMQSAGSPASISQPCSMYVVGGLTVTGGAKVLCDSKTAQEFAILITGGDWRVIIGGSAGDSGIVQSTGLHCFAYASASSSTNTFYYDGTTVNIGAVGSGTPTPITLGANNAGGSNITGFLCEVAWYTSAFSAGDLSTIRSYAQSKWGTP